MAISSAGGAHSIQDSLAQRMQRALMTWQHPSASMPAAAIAALAASKQGAEALEQRRSAWREAFRSLYMAVQAGSCHAFYFVTPQVHAAFTSYPTSSYICTAWDLSFRASQS